MRVLVTGGAGKLGQWVVRELEAHAHDVTVFDRVTQSGAGGRFVSGDIQDLGQVFGAVADVDAVIHLAGIYTHGLVANEVTFRTNAMGTFNVHEAAWRLGVRRVVTLSSEAVLGWAPNSWQREHMPEYLPIDEAHPCRPQDCYGLSKVAAEAVARSYTDKCGMETVLIRAPWITSPDELIALRTAGGRTPTQFGTYHYIDARDLSTACRLAIERPLTGCEILFVGSGESTVAEPLCKLLPRLMPSIGHMADDLVGNRSAVSTEKARALLDWSPRWSWRGDPDQ